MTHENLTQIADKIKQNNLKQHITEIETQSSDGEQITYECVLTDTEDRIIATSLAKTQIDATIKSLAKAELNSVQTHENLFNITSVIQGLLEVNLHLLVKTTDRDTIKVVITNQHNQIIGTGYSQDIEMAVNQALFKLNAVRYKK